MARRATGSVYWLRDEQGTWRWHARVSLADGTRPYEPLEGEAWCTDPKAREIARKEATKLSAQLRGMRAVKADAPLTFGEWHKGFIAHKAAKGKRSIATMKGRAEHFLADLGHRPIAEITREEIEAIVAKLDAAIVAWTKGGGKRGSGLSTGTCANIWGDLAHAFDEAVNAKDRALRVLKVNPCADVRGPDTGDDREGRSFTRTRSWRCSAAWRSSRAKSGSPCTAAASTPWPSTRARVVRSWRPSRRRTSTSSTGR
jgi:hypothetical protein